MQTDPKEYNHLLVAKQAKNTKPKWVIGIIILAIVVVIIILLAH
jgi:hypothetical protein